MDSGCYRMYLARGTHIAGSYVRRVCFQYAKGILILIGYISY